MSTEKSKDTHPTRRAVADGIEPLLYETLPVLDHGFVRVIDYMGNDAAITQAARVSYGSGTKQVQQDRGLIRYLMRHWHTTPFEMCEIKLHVNLKSRQSKKLEFSDNKNSETLTFEFF